MPKKRTFLILLIGLLSAVGLCLLLLFLPEKKEGESDSDEANAQILFDYNDPACVTALSYVYDDHSPLSLIYADNRWQVKDRSTLPIDSSQIKGLLNRLEYMLALREISDQCENLTEYGLDKPLCTVSIWVDGEEKTYLFGSYNAYYEGYYCTTAERKEIYITDKTYTEQFDLTLEELLGSDSLPETDGLLSVVWQAADGTISTSNMDGENSQLAKLLSTLRPGKWIDYGSEQFHLFGLDRSASAVLTFRDQESVTLYFGRGETDEYVYLRIGESEMIYLAECDDLTLLSSYVESVPSGER